MHYEHVTAHEGQPMREMIDDLGEEPYETTSSQFNVCQSEALWLLYFICMVQTHAAMDSGYIATPVQVSAMP